MYYVYYAIDRNGNPKVGCTSQPEKRFKKYKEGKLLHCYTDAKEAGDKEIELQIKYFGKRDGYTHYVDMLKKGRRGDEDIKKKISSGLKLAYKEGRRDNWDNSFFQSKEYKEKLSKKSLEMWKDPKRKEANLKGCDVSNALLSEDDVRFIRKTYFKRINQYVPIPQGMMSLGQLQKKFNCSKGVIIKLINGQTYTSVK